MNHPRTKFARGALTLSGALLLTACGGNGLDGVTQSVTGLFVSNNVEPLYESIAQEYCVAPLAAQRFGSGDMETVARKLGQVQNAILSDERKADSTFCDQNLGGVVLLTDRSMNRALDKAGDALGATALALDTNTAAQRAALARIARMRNVSLGEKLQPEYLEEMRALNDEMARLSEDTEAELERLMDSDGISPEAQAHLQEAHQHFVDFRHYQGKAIAGVTIFESARGIYGNEVLVQAFKQALKIDRQRAAAQGVDRPNLTTTEDLISAFMGALPKFVETTYSGGAISNAIWKAADTGDFEEALEEINTVSSEETEDFANYSDEVEFSSRELGLPSVQSTTS